MPEKKQSLHVTVELKQCIMFKGKVVWRASWKCWAYRKLISKVIINSTHFHNYFLHSFSETGYSSLQGKVFRNYLKVYAVTFISNLFHVFLLLFISSLMQKITLFFYFSGQLTLHVKIWESLTRIYQMQLK